MSRLGERRAAWVLSAFFAVTCLPAGGFGQEVTPASLRALLERRVGDLELLRVPLRDEDLPQPLLADGSGLDPRFAITPAKVRLGKFLFHDPIRSTDIVIDDGGREDFRQSASCASCHLAPAASKAGQVFNFGVGGEGRLEMDASGGMIVERHQEPTAVDAVPTGVVVRDDEGNVVLDGGKDAVDSVPRVAPTVIGAAYNVRLLWDGAAGEENEGINPDELPAAESIVQLASMNHRMFVDQHLPLQALPVYRELFARAFPDEFAEFEASGDPNDYINADTIQRAIAAFLRTVITRDTPWDHFLRGDDSAMTSRQLRGAYLFALPAAEGGADCLACHSGPALNKIVGDEAGVLVEENFFNLGLNDHPLQDQVREVLDDPSHRDRGREAVTGLSEDAFEFRTTTLRQLRDAGPFMHSGELATVREVVEYFNDGVAADPEAGSAESLSSLFTHPRGDGALGLGLQSTQIDALVDFLENALYDPAFVSDTPGSPTKPFDPSARELDYEPELEALGAIDGWLPSRMSYGNDDPLSRSQMLFVRGRVNDDDSVDIADAIYLLDYLFAARAAPVNMFAADVNHDFRIDLADPIYLLNTLFGRGPPPPAPYPELGQLFL